MAFGALLLSVISVFIVDVAGKTCVCNKDEAYQAAVFNSTQSNSVIGYIHPHQCSTYMNTSNTNGSRLAVQINGETGYVENNADFILVAECPGTLPNVLPTAPLLTSSSSTPSTSGCIKRHVSSALTGNVSLCPHYVRQVAKLHCHLLTQRGHSCYEMSNRRVSWTHANQTCTERGGHLVTIHTAHENTYLHQILMQLNYTHYVWIGLQDRDSEGRFHWVTGEKLTYTNWSSNATHTSLGHPHNNIQDCGVLLTSGEWEDVRCGGNDPVSEATAVKRAFICEYKTHESGAFIIG